VRRARAPRSYFRLQLLQQTSNAQALRAGANRGDLHRLPDHGGKTWRRFVIFLEIAPAVLLGKNRVEINRRKKKRKIGANNSRSSLILTISFAMILSVVDQR
jgi:hypothetical protein